MKIISAICMVLFLIACKKDEGNSIKETLIIEETKSSLGGIGCIFESDGVKIYGDTSIDQGKMYFTKIKFQPYITFSDFKSDSIYRGGKSLIDLGSNAIITQYENDIYKNYKFGEINFGGYYTSIYWNCGTDCLNGAIVDWRDGKVYSLPPSSKNYSFKKDSKMLIVNKPDKTGYYYENTYHQPQIWLWNEEEKEFVHLGKETI